MGYARYFPYSRENAAYLLLMRGLFFNLKQV